MALLLRKVWGSVLTRSGSTSSSGSCSIRSSSDLGEDPNSSMGEFDLIPTDVLMQILRLLGPREAARSSLVCRAWRALVADNRLWIFFLQNGKELWDCIVFSETHLRGGSPYLTYYGHTPQLSFMRIYAQRAVIPGSVIVDGGSGYCKFGWSKYSSPSGRSATFLEFGNIESPMYARLHHFFSTIYTRMRVKPSSQPIIVVIPICHCDDTESAKASRKQYRETIYSVLFDMNVPAVCAIDQAVLALYAAKRTSGIVVNIGFNVTSVVPNVTDFCVLAYFVTWLSLEVEERRMLDYLHQLHEEKVHKGSRSKYSADDHHRQIKNNDSHRNRRVDSRGLVDSRCYRSVDSERGAIVDSIGTPR